MVTKSLIECDRATYSAWKVEKEDEPCSLDTNMIEKSENNYKASYWLHTDWIMLVFWSVQHGKSCIYVAINRHLAWMADNQPFDFTIFDITLKVSTYTKKLFLMWVIMVVVDFFALVNKICYILTGGVWKIHQNDDNWWIFPRVLVLSWIFHYICSQRRLYICMYDTSITTLYNTSINNIIY